MISEAGNGVVVNRFGDSNSQGSWDLHSIDGIRCGCARPTRNYRSEMKLHSETDTGFSDLTNVTESQKITKNHEKPCKSVETMKNHVSTCSGTQKMFSEKFQTFRNLSEFFGFDVLFMIFPNRQKCAFLLKLLSKS